MIMSTLHALQAIECLLMPDPQESADQAVRWLGLQVGHTAGVKAM